MAGTLVFLEAPNPKSLRGMSDIVDLLDESDG